MYRVIAKSLLLLLLISGCADDTKEELFNEGMELLNGNSPRGAIVLFRKALEKDQNFTEARYQLGLAYYHATDYESAEKELRKVIMQSPSSRYARITLAKVYLQKGKPDDALKELYAVKDGTSSDAEALELAGLAYAEKGDYSIAEKLLEKAESVDEGRGALVLADIYLRQGESEKAEARVLEMLKEDPSNRSALHFLAKVQRDKNDLDAVKGTYRRILEAYPSDREAMYRLGVLFMESGEVEEALSIGDQMIEDYPQESRGYLLRGMTLFKKGKFNDSIIQLQKSLSIQPGLQGYYFLGLCHFYRKELEQALSQFYRALDTNPSSIQTRLLVAMVLLRQKRADEGITELKRVLELDEQNPIAHNLLGSALMEKGSYDEGLDELNRAIEIEPELVDVYIKKGFYNFRKGHIEEAESELQAALDVAPEIINSRIALASYYMKLNKYDEALKILGEGVTGSRSDVMLYNLMGDALIHKNRISEAIGHLQKAKKADPDHETAYFNLALVYVFSGEYEKAIDELVSITERKPGNLKALSGIAFIYEMTGRVNEAHEYYLKAGKTGKTEGLIALAKYYLRNKKQNEALDTLQRGIETSPSYIVLHTLKGRILLSMERFKDALRSFREVQRIDQRRGIYYVLDTYIRMNKPDEAMREVQKALGKDPERLDLLAEIPRILTVMGRKKEAYEQADRIITDNPEAPDGYLALAELFFGDEKTERAIEVLENAPIGGKQRIPIYMMLGNIHAKRKNYSLALDSFSRAAEITPGYVAAVLGQGSALQFMGRKEEAVNKYLRVIALSRNHVPALNNLAYLYAEGNEHLDSAHWLALRAYLNAPEDGSVIDTFGYVMLRRGRVGEAVNALEKAVALSPDNPSVYYHLSLAYRELGDTSRAVNTLRKSLDFGGFPEAERARSLLARLTEDPPIMREE